MSASESGRPSTNRAEFVTNAHAAGSGSGSVPSVSGSGLSANRAEIVTNGTGGLSDEGRRLYMLSSRLAGATDAEGAGPLTREEMQEFAALAAGQTPSSSEGVFARAWMMRQGGDSKARTPRAYEGNWRFLNYVNPSNYGQASTNPYLVSNMQAAYRKLATDAQSIVTTLSSSGLVGNAEGASLATQLQNLQREASQRESFLGLAHTYDHKKTVSWEEMTRLQDLRNRFQVLYTKFAEFQSAARAFNVQPTNFAEQQVRALLPPGNQYPGPAPSAPSPLAGNLPPLAEQVRQLQDYIRAITAEINAHLQGLRGPETPELRANVQQMRQYGAQAQAQLNSLQSQGAAASADAAAQYQQAQQQSLADLARAQAAQAQADAAARAQAAAQYQGMAAQATELRRYALAQAQQEEQTRLLRQQQAQRLQQDQDLARNANLWRQQQQQEQMQRFGQQRQQMGQQELYDQQQQQQLLAQQLAQQRQLQEDAAYGRALSVNEFAGIQPQQPANPYGANPYLPPNFDPFALSPSQQFQL